MSLRPTRRAVLSAGAVGVVAACTPSRRPSASRSARPDPDVALTAAAVDRELALLAAYDAALAATPALASRLAPLRAEHAEHLIALGTGRTPVGSPASSPTRSTLASLSAAERTAAAAHAAAAVTASARLAGVLASLAASEASHQAALG